MNSSIIILLLEKSGTQSDITSSSTSSLKIYFHPVSSGQVSQIRPQALQLKKKKLPQVDLSFVLAFFQESEPKQGWDWISFGTQDLIVFISKTRNLLIWYSSMESFLLKGNLCQFWHRISAMDSHIDEAQWRSFLTYEQPSSFSRRWERGKLRITVSDCSVGLLRSTESKAFY